MLADIRRLESTQEIIGCQCGSHSNLAIARALPFLLWQHQRMPAWRPYPNQVVGRCRGRCRIRSEPPFHAACQGRPIGLHAPRRQVRDGSRSGPRPSPENIRRANVMDRFVSVLGRHDQLGVAVLYDHAPEVGNNCVQGFRVVGPVRHDRCRALVADIDTEGGLAAHGGGS